MYKYDMCIPQSNRLNAETWRTLEGEVQGLVEAPMVTRSELVMTGALFLGANTR